MYYPGDVARRGTSNQKKNGISGVDRMCLGPSIGIIARALIPRIITGAIECDVAASHTSDQQCDKSTCRSREPEDH